MRFFFTMLHHKLYEGRDPQIIQSRCVKETEQKFLYIRRSADSGRIRRQLAHEINHF